MRALLNQAFQGLMLSIFGGSLDGCRNVGDQVLVLRHLPLYTMLLESRATLPPKSKQHRKD